MSHPLQDLIAEHARIRSMLDCFDAELDRFEEASRPDYDIFEGSIDYCQEYLDRWHHPREDALLERLRRRAPGEARACEGLEDQHDALGHRTRDFVNVLEAVVRDIPFVRADLAKHGRALSQAYREHLDWEEIHFFPVVKRSLTAEDWDAVAADFVGSADPLTDNPVDQRYRSLLRAIADSQVPDS